MSERRLLGEAEDDTCGGYEWGFARVYQDGDKFYIIYDSGCSCNSPEDTYGPESAIVGPTEDLGGLLTQMMEYPGDYTRTVKEAFLDAVKRVNDETYDLTKRALKL